VAARKCAINHCKCIKSALNILSASNGACKALGTLSFFYSGGAILTNLMYMYVKS